MADQKTGEKVFRHYRYIEFLFHFGFENFFDPKDVERLRIEMKPAVD